MPATPGTQRAHLRVAEPDTYTVTLEPLTPAEYRRVMAALEPLNVGLLTTVTAMIEWTPDVAGQVSATAPDVSIDGRDLPALPPCTWCGHAERKHTGAPGPGIAHGRECHHRTPDTSRTLPSTGPQCRCPGYTTVPVHDCESCGHSVQAHRDGPCAALGCGCPVFADPEAPAASKPAKMNRLCARPGCDHIRGVHANDGPCTGVSYPRGHRSACPCLAFSNTRGN
jgi:hypothetical protein